jgi:transposase-like protein
VWFLFTGKSRTKRVADGESLREHCPVCKRTTLFVEVEVEHAAGLFFIDLISDKEHKFACTGCGETFDRVLEAGASAPKQLPAAAPVKTQRQRVEELAAEQRRRDASKAQIAAKIDDELAELKRRMGRS